MSTPFNWPFHCTVMNTSKNSFGPELSSGDGKQSPRFNMALPVGLAWDRVTLGAVTPCDPLTPRPPCRGSRGRGGASLSLSLYLSLSHTSYTWREERQGDLLCEYK